MSYTEQINLQYFRASIKIVWKLYNLVGITIIDKYNSI